MAHTMQLFHKKIDSSNKRKTIRPVIAKTTSKNENFMSDFEEVRSKMELTKHIVIREAEPIFHPTKKSQQVSVTSSPFLYQSFLSDHNDEEDENNRNSMSMNKQRNTLFDANDSDLVVPDDRSYARETSSRKQPENDNFNLLLASENEIENTQFYSRFLEEKNV